MPLILYIIGWVGIAWMVGCFTNFRTASVLATIKVLLPALYFALVHEQGFGLRDGLAYYADGMTISQAFGPIEVWLSNDGRQLLYERANYGPHVLYGWWNSVMYTLTGRPEAIVLGNVAASTLAACAIYRIAILLKVGTSYAQGLFIFQLLNPELLAWSSATNTKDTIVMLVTTLGMWSMIGFQGRWQVRYLLGLSVLCVLLIGLRFYLPGIILIAWAGAAMINFRGVKLAAVLLGVIIAGAIFLWAVEVRWLFKGLERMELYGLLGNVVRFVLTPRPWGIENDYVFLTIPSIWHWLAAVPAVIGAVYFWRMFLDARLLVIYALLIIGLYGTLDEFLGPRQRLQISFIYVWFQFHFFWVAVNRHNNSTQDTVSLRKETKGSFA